MISLYTSEYCEIKLKLKRMWVEVLQRYLYVYMYSKSWSIMYAFHNYIPFSTMFTFDLQIDTVC